MNNDPNLLTWRVKVAVKEWVKMTSGYEYPSPGVQIMSLTVAAKTSLEAREVAKTRLALMELEGHVEDVSPVVPSPPRLHGRAGEDDSGAEGGGQG